eukprot:g26188.t1
MEDERRWLAEAIGLLQDMAKAHERGQTAISSNIAGLISVNKEFTPGQQADAHEAFMFIIERLLTACLAVGVGGTENPVLEAARSSPADKEPPMALQAILLSAFATLGGLACGAAGSRALLRRGPKVSRLQRASGAFSALVLVIVGLIGLLWCFLSPPPFSIEVDGPPSYLRNDPTRSVYFGNGCFWHTQYDFVVLEQHPAGPFRRNDTEVTSLVGYAGGRFQSPSGAVCYHGWPGTDYSRLGHAEAVSIELDTATGELARKQVAALAKDYFEHGFQSLPDGRRLRLDPQDVGAEYRNVIGLPGGMDNQELWPLIEAGNAYGMPLRRGAIGDSEGEFVVYVYDSVQYPFFRGEASHQFHPNSVIQRPVPASYTGDLKATQAQLGRIAEDRGCTGLPVELSALIAFVCAAACSMGLMFLYSSLFSETKAFECIRPQRVASAHDVSHGSHA